MTHSPSNIILETKEINQIHFQDNETQKLINLNFNENPFGCFSSVTVAMTNALNEARLYPDDPLAHLVRQLATYHSVHPDQILLADGLSSILRITTEAYVHAEDKLLMANPTFERIKFYAENRGAKVTNLALSTDLAHDLKAILAQVDSTTKLIYICNPNNPTGSITPRRDIEEFLQKLPENVSVFIDEAYHHFAKCAPDYTSFLEKPLFNNRVIVGRTFSKVYGLAGMRLGYAVSSIDTIKHLKKFTAEDSINVAVMKGASEALKDEAALHEMLKNFADARDEFYKQAKARDLDYIPTYANFIMLGTGKLQASEVIDHFKQHNIIIGRQFSSMQNHVRISFGRPTQMVRFWHVWDKLAE